MLTRPKTLGPADYRSQVLVRPSGGRMPVFAGVMLIAQLLSAPVAPSRVASPPTTSQPRGPSAVTWAIKAPPSKLSLLNARQTFFAISTGDSAIHNVRVVHSTLQDPNTSALLGAQWLKICLSASDSCERVDVDRRRIQGMLLRVDNGFRQPGVFAGSVSIAVDESADPISFELTVSSSTLWRRRWGAVFVFLGVLVSWLVTLLRYEIARDRELTAAKLVCESLLESQARIEAASKKTKVEMLLTMSCIEKTLKRLSAHALEGKGFVPPLWPSLLAPPSDKSDGYKALLTETANIAGAVAELVASGINVVAGEWKPDHIDELTKALKTLDAAGNTVQSPSEARAIAKQVLEELHGKHAVKPQALEQLQGQEPAELTVTKLAAQERFANSILWLAMGVLTVFVGWAILVAPNAGFGTEPDYIKCILWGLGIQAAGQQLTQLTPSTVTSTFGVTLR